MPCGVNPLETLRRAGYVAKNKSMMAMRESPVKRPDGYYLQTYDPYLAKIEPDKQQVIEWDVRLAHRLLTTGTIKPITGKYEWVSSYASMIADIEASFGRTGKPVKVAFDSETMGLSPHYPDKDFVCLQFSHKPGISQLLYLGTHLPHPVQLDHRTPLFDQIKWLLTTPKVRLRMANGKFDLLWVKEKWGIDCTNFTFDTLLVGSLLDENRSNSLNLHAKLMTPFGGYDDAFNAKYDKGKMEQVPVDDMLVYAGGDTDACYTVAEVLQAELDEVPALKNFYVNILHPAARAFEKVERRGVLVDPQKFAVLADDLKKVIDKSQKRQLELLPNTMRIKYRARIDDQLAQGKNPMLPSILNEFFFTPHGLNLTPRLRTPKDQKPSLAKAHLRAVGEGHPAATEFIAAMTEGDSASKTLSTFVLGFLRHLRPDMRIHPSYMLFHGGFGDDEDDESGTVCVTADTLFATDRGVIPFTALKVGDQTISHLGVCRPIVALVDNGVKPVLEVKLSNGDAITCTENHPFRVGSEWVRADRLQAQQEVAVLPETESWKEIEGWPFSVSTWGRVRSAKGTILQQHRKNVWGHLKVCLFRNGARKRGPDRRDFPVHRLVAEAFVPRYGPVPDLRHRNGIAWDNRPSNLVWGTAADNRRDMRLHGTGQGAHGTQAKVDWGAVAHMRACSQSDKELAAQYGVSRELVRDIRANKKWVVRTHAERSVQFATAKVVSVTYVGDLPSFGATVADDHSHVTNGIVTHNTGRLSAKDPAFQIIPKKTFWAKRIRACYPAPPGKVIVLIDYSQGELKVVACFAPEKTMLQAYLDKLDLHAVTGAKLAGVELEEFLTWKDNDDKELADLFDKHRGNAKPANFGLLYGQQVEGFIAYAWANYGIKLTFAEGEKMRNAFFQLYPGLLNFHDRQRSIVDHTGQVISPLGRIRHLPAIRSPDRRIRSKSERQAINSPIQSTLADMMCWAIALIEAELGETFQVVGNIHDALVAYVDADKAQLLIPQAQHIMANLPFHKVNWKPQLQFTCDAEVGPNLSDVKKFKLAA
jgi:DNA polymerase I-like protein with 3'-5' exonuclease and polymerase domains